MSRGKINAVVAGLAVLLTACGLNADVIAGWNFYGNTAVESNAGQDVNVAHANVTVGKAIKQTGVQYASVGLANTWTVRGGNAATLSDAISSDDYLYFTIDPDAGQQVTITNLSFYAARNSTSNPTVTMFTAASGFAEAAALGSVVVNVNNPAAPSLFEISGLDVKFTALTQVRLYIHGTSAEDRPVWFGDSDTDLGNTNLLVQGTVEAIPEPGTVGLLAISSLGLFVLRRLRS